MRVQVAALLAFTGASVSLPLVVRSLNRTLLHHLCREGGLELLLDAVARPLAKVVIVEDFEEVLEGQHLDILGRLVFAENIVFQCDQ